MAVRGRITTVPFEPDVNHPDYREPTACTATEVSVGDDEVLFIYAKNTNGFPPSKWIKYCEQTRERFETAMPGVKVIVGAYDLKFTTISRKSVFKAKLDGSLSENDA